MWGFISSLRHAVIVQEERCRISLEVSWVRADGCQWWPGQVYLHTHLCAKNPPYALLYVTVTFQRKEKHIDETDEGGGESGVKTQPALCLAALS